MLRGGQGRWGVRGCGRAWTSRVRNEVGLSRAGGDMVERLGFIYFFIFITIFSSSLWRYLTTSSSSLSSVSRFSSSLVDCVVICELSSSPLALWSVVSCRLQNSTRPTYLSARQSTGFREVFGALDTPIALPSTFSSRTIVY